MATKKANRKLSRSFISSVFLVILLLATSPGWATISQQSVVLSTDNNSDGVAGIGDVIGISCRSTVTTDDPVFTAMNIGITNEPLVQLTGTLFTKYQIVSPGIHEGLVSFNISDTDETKPLTPSFYFDNRRPGSTTGVFIHPTPTGIGGVFKRDDHLKLELELSNADGDVVTANLSSLGLSSATRFQPLNPHILDVPIPLNREANNIAIPVKAVDDAGNDKIWNDVSISYDTISPAIKSVIITNTTATTNPYVKAGDAIRISVEVTKFDNDIVTAASPKINNNTAITLDEAAGSAIGTTVVFEKIVYITETDLIQNSTIFFNVTVTDDAGNTTTGTSNSLKIDSVPPEFNGYPVIKIFRNTINTTEPQRTAIINDMLQISGFVAADMPDIVLTVDLTSIGGASNQTIEFTDHSIAPSVSTTSFLLNYQIIQYTSENSTPRDFTITAKDLAGNIKTKVTLPTILVDNYPPTISGGQVQNVSRPGQPARFGDQIAITATVGNIDNGNVWVDLRKIGGDASSTLSLSGTSYRIDHVVNDSLIGGITDGPPLDFIVYAADDSGNTVKTFTNSISIDNEQPLVSNASYAVNPALLAPNHSYVRVGDRLTFNVQLASSSSSIYDGQTVKINLADLGQTAPVVMTYTAGGNYSTSITVPAGTLNYEHLFTYTVTDNAGNETNGTIQVPIDNAPPDVGPMGVNFLTDLSKTGAVNIGDILEFIIPVNDNDGGFCILDLSLIGGSATTNLSNYDPTLRRYYHVQTCSSFTVTTENPSYVFRAIVYDKAFNTMNSLSSTREVDCRPPTITSFASTLQELKDKAGVINTGDRIKFTATLDLSSLDAAVPAVNISMLGGPSNQQLYDDGAHSDGAAGDGEFSYTHTVLEGSTNGASFTPVLTVVDNAGNRVTIADKKPDNSTQEYWVDNQSPVITSVTNTQKVDTNGNRIVDLDGKYTATATYDIDSIVLRIVTTDTNSGKPALVTVDLTKFGYSDVARIVPALTNKPTEYEVVIEPIRGSTNNEDVKLTVRVTDENGNETIGLATNAIKVDNLPPTIDIYPITFVVDNGRIGEANRGDVIQIKVKVTNHDGMLPMIDFVNLYTNNGMTPPSATLFPPNPYDGNEYTYQWTVPEGLGTKEGLTIIAIDASGNMTYKYTDEVRFLSKTPRISAFPYSRLTLFENTELTNNIANPGERLVVTCSIDSLYSSNNAPPAKVLVDIRGITNKPGDDDPGFEDGDANTYWVALTASTTTTPFIYNGDFTIAASDKGIDANNFNLTAKILHPDTNAITMATAQITSDPDSPIGIDTRVPRIKPNTTPSLTIVQNNGDNLSSYTANIGDIMKVQANIDRLTDPGSVTAILYYNLTLSTVQEAFRIPMNQVLGTDLWEGTFVVATGTKLSTDELAIDEWRNLNGEVIKFQVFMSDDADNLATSSLVTPSPNIKIDNNPPQIKRTPPASNRIQLVDNNNDGSWVANVYNGQADSITGLASDSIYAWVELAAGDLNSRAYVDFSPIGGTSTYMLEQLSADRFSTNNSAVYPANYAHFLLTNGNYDLATHTFRIYVVDAAGNRDYIEDEYNRIAVDTRRPTLDNADYDGSILILNFSEIIKPGTLNINNIRLGHKPDHKDIRLDQSSVVSLSTARNDLLLFPDDPNSTKMIQLGSYTRSVIADWGKDKTIYISIASNDNDNGSDYNPATGILALDVAGNWLQPIPRLTMTTVFVTNDYIRPSLISGTYNANTTQSERDYLYLKFNKAIDPNTLTTNKTLKNLAIWFNRASSNENWVNSYRFATLANDSFNPSDIIGDNTIKIKLSQEAQDWIAVKYGRLASRFHLQINGSEYEPPSAYPPEANLPLIRDAQGNAVIPILPANAVEGTITPLNTSFQISSTIKLDISSTTPVLTIVMQNRRARLFDDTYSESTLALAKTMPVDLSRVFLCEKLETNTGRSISLGSRSNTTPMVDWSKFASLNDFASTTVQIPLTAEALKIMLSWSTSKFYLACSTTAFKDLWGNGSDMFPGTSGTGAELDPVKPATTLPPSITTVALRPVVNYNNANLFKTQPVDGLIYEVAFDTATLSANVRIPIDKTKTPGLKVLRSDSTEIHNTRFIAWTEHVQNGVTRTVAQFANLELPTSAADQRVPATVEITGIADIFGKVLLNNRASYVYDLNKRENSGATSDGFLVASYPLQFDNYPPRALSATSTSPIGITAAGNLKVTVVFNEELDQTASIRPTLRMMQGANTVMNFAFESMSGTVATFSNSSAFDASAAQGECYYAVSGGYDIAGNPGSQVSFSATPVFVYSKGPNIKAFKVQTHQTTTAKPGYEFSYNAPFSPLVPPGIATISIEFDTLPRDNAGWLTIYVANQSTPVASLSARPSGSSTVWEAAWDGRRSDGTFIDNAEITYELRFFDLSGNEGNRRGSITLDSNVPKVDKWEFANLKTHDNKAYFSPVAQSAAKINVITSVGQSMKMRLVQPGVSTDTYLMASSGSSYSINFDGKSTDNPARTLTGQFEVSLVDLAGNVGQAMSALSKATSTLVIDREAPVISSINMFKADASGAKEVPEVPVIRFNSRARKLLIEVIEGYSSSPMISGTGLIRIMAGSTMLRELVLQQTVVGDPFFSLWDGKNTNGELLTDGKYTVLVADLAGNIANKSAEIEVVSSDFKFTAATQYSPDSIRLVFSHGINTANSLNPSPFTVKPEGLPEISLSGAVISSIDSKVITASFSATLVNGKTYTITITNLTGFLSEDGAEIAAGNNQQSFTADTVGPVIVPPVTYDGVTSQKKFNVVFNEQIESVSALNTQNYKLSLGTTTIQIDEIALRADLKSVTITAASDIIQGNTYTLTVTGVKDQIGNLSNTTIPFEGRDVTPPALTITAFSNPANEFDIVLIVKADEDISGQPSATITQSGGTAVSLLLNSGTDLRMFIGGAHLDRNYPGVATIKVTAKDLTLNSGTANMSFSTAFVNASMRASVKSADSNVEAIFEPGTLNRDSLVMIMPEDLSKVSNETSRGSRIMPSALAGMSSAQLASIRASSVAVSTDRAAEELEPLGQAYSLVVPAGRLSGSVAIAMKIETEQVPAGAALYYSDGSSWQPVACSSENGIVRFAASAAGTFAMMRDVKAPRASMINDLTSAPLRESRPVFTWNIEEFASGIEIETAVAVLNDRQYPVMFDTTGSIARFVPVEGLVSGNHSIGLRIADKAGNINVLPAIRFAAQPPLQINEVVQFPNPARNRVNIRISTNRKEVDAEEIRVKIYDAAGHMVASTNDLTMRAGSNGAGKVVQDVIWDLRNKDGKAVANGVYFAKIELKDPDNLAKKTRYTHKIAVLR